MKRGDLVRVPGEAGNLWMVVRYAPDPHAIEPDVLIKSVKTGYSMWALWHALEIVSEAR